MKELAWLPGTVGILLAGVVACGSASAAPVVFEIPSSLQQDDARHSEMTERAVAVVPFVDNALLASLHRAPLHRAAAPVEAHLGLAPLARATPPAAPEPTDEAAEPPASASLVTSLLTENSEPGVISLIAIGAVLCRLGARVMRIRR